MCMPIIRLTKRAIAEIPVPKQGQVLYYDDQLRGFGLRVGLRSKVYIAEAQVRRRTVRVTLGKYELLTPEKARTKALAALSQMAEGINPNALKAEATARAITLQDAFTRFFADKTRLSPHTVANYTRTVDVYLADWATRPLAEITREMILARHRKISELNGGITANNVMRHFRSVYNYTSATVGELPPNPVAIIGQAGAWAPQTRRQGVIALHALPRWYRAVMSQDEQARDFLLIAILTGMRRSEIATLRWEYIDLEGMTLRIPHTKNGDPLELPLSNALADLLRVRRKLTNGPWVFPGRGKSGHLMEMKSFVARVAKASGVKFTVHDLRRTFVTFAESLDIPAYALKRLLNHRSSGDVTAGYLVIGTERLRKPVEQIATFILEKAREL